MIQQTLMGWNAEVKVMPDGSRILVFVEAAPVPTGNIIMYPMDADTATAVGHKLSAPSIETGTAANVKSIVSARSARG